MVYVCLCVCVCCVACAHRDKHDIKSNTRENDALKRHHKGLRFLLWFGVSFCSFFMVLGIESRAQHVIDESFPIESPLQPRIWFIVFINRYALKN